MSWIKKSVFRFWENEGLRNWGLTFLFLIAASIGFRFAWFAWHVGNRFDQFLAILGGIMMGALTGVTLVRIWNVSPVQTGSGQGLGVPSLAPKFEMVRYQQNVASISGENFKMAKAAAALGSTRTKSIY